MHQIPGINESFHCWLEPASRLHPELIVVPDPLIGGLVDEEITNLTEARRCHYRTHVFPTAAYFARSFGILRASWPS